MVRTKVATNVLAHGEVKPQYRDLQPVNLEVAFNIH